MMQVETRNIKSNDPRDWSQTYSKERTGRFGITSATGMHYHTYEQQKRQLNMDFKIRYPPLAIQERHAKLAEMRRLKQTTARHRYDASVTEIPDVPAYQLPIRTTVQEVALATPFAKQPVYTVAPPHLRRPQARAQTAPAVMSSLTSSLHADTSSSVPSEDAARSADAFRRHQMQLLLKNTYIVKPLEFNNCKPPSIDETGTTELDRKFFRLAMFGPRPRYF